MKSITKINLKNLAAEGIRAKMHRLEKELSDLGAQLKSLVGLKSSTSKTGKKRGRPKGSVKTKKDRNKVQWTPERRAAFSQKMKDVKAKKKANTGLISEAAPLPQEPSSITE